jgi:dephospho-CoA kinase
MLRVGLTGSIAVGKSYVTSVFEELGCHVLDADQTAREVVEPGAAGLRAIVESFGRQVLKDDGTLNRARLGELIFADSELRQRLNSILHPFIMARQDEVMREWEAQDPDGIGIIDAALMIESGGYKRFDKLIVVHCRPEVQLERLILRTGLSPEQAKQRIAAQMSQEEKQRYADYLIDTSDGFDITTSRVREIFNQLRQSAESRK